MHQNFRKRRLVSVSTSFSATPGEFEEALKKIKNSTMRYKHGKQMSELNAKRDDDEEMINTDTIKEVESEEEPDNESSDDDRKLKMQKHLSEFPIRDRVNSDPM